MDCLDSPFEKKVGVPLRIVLYIPSKHHVAKVSFKQVGRQIPGPLTCKSHFPFLDSTLETEDQNT